MDGGGADDDLFDTFSLDAVDDVLISLDGPSSRPAKAAPRLPGRFQPKFKGKAPKSEPATETVTEPWVFRKQGDGLVEEKLPLLPVKKQEDASRTFAAESSGRDGSAEPDDLAFEGTGPMDVDDVQEEDVVVREFDVYLSSSPPEADTQLFAIQYPLRPSWRPYDLDKICGVRVKLEQKLVEFDIASDYSENYDDEIEKYPQKHTFSSSRSPLLTSHCVGFLKKNQLHLKPINAVVQLRPSIDYNKSGEEKRPVSRNQGSNVLSNNALEPSSSEDWVSVEFHTSESHVSKEYMGKMEAQDDSNIPFSMRSCDYLANLCPGVSVGTRGPSKQHLFTLPLEERFKVLFSQGPQVHRFSSLMHLAPKDSAKEDILALLPQFAVLVQGLWVSKSSLLFEGSDALSRDYILLLFHKSNIIPKKKLEPIKPALIEQIMPPLARERPSGHFKDWKFREVADTEFLKCYSDSDIVHRQQCFWSDLEQRFETYLQRNVKKGSMSQRGPTTNSMDRTRGKNSNEGSGSTAIPDQARDILPKAIIKVLRYHKVCRLNTICQKLQDFVINETVLAKRSPNVAAACNFIDPRSKELHDIIGQVAIEIHDVYVLKSVDTATDQFRNVVIGLLRGIPRNEKLKKAVIIEAAHKVLGKDIPMTEYNQVLNELCITQGGGWVLKPGDGKPE